MPWGKHKGKPIGDVPLDYLLQYYRKGWVGGEVLKYLEAQLKVLEEAEKMEAERTGKKPKKYIIEDYEYNFPFATKP